MDTVVTWQGWAAVAAIGTVIAAIGTVGTLLLLGSQSRALWRQVRQDNEFRDKDDRRRKAALERASTPMLTLARKGPVIFDHMEPELVEAGLDAGSFFVDCTLTAHGAGIAQNVRLAVEYRGAALNSIVPVILVLAAPNSTDVSLYFPGELRGDIPLRGVTILIRFQNIYDQLVEIRYGNCQILQWGLVAPTAVYRWPLEWEPPDDSDQPQVSA